MKVVIDTNVVVSALLKPSSVPASILGLVVEEKITPCYDSRILIEYIEVLNRPKFNFAKSEIAGLVEFIRDVGDAFVAPACEATLSDPDDLPFFEVAVVSHAQFLITGNTTHFPKKIEKTRVVSPASFIQAFHK